MADTGGVHPFGPAAVATGGTAPFNQTESEPLSSISQPFSSFTPIPLPIPLPEGDKMEIAAEKSMGLGNPGDSGPSLVPDFTAQPQRFRQSHSQAPGASVIISSQPTPSMTHQKRQCPHVYQQQQRQRNHHGQEQHQPQDPHPQHQPIRRVQSTSSLPAVPPSSTSQTPPRPLPPSQTPPPPYPSQADWSDHETRCLITLRASMEAQFSSTSRNKDLWKSVATKLAQKDYCRSWEQCKVKWKNLLSKYKEIKEQGMKKLPEEQIAYMGSEGEVVNPVPPVTVGKKPWRFWEDVNDVIRSRMGMTGERKCGSTFLRNGNLEKSRLQSYGSCYNLGNATGLRSSYVTCYTSDIPLMTTPSKRRAEHQEESNRSKLCVHAEASEGGLRRSTEARPDKPVVREHPGESGRHESPTHVFPSNGFQPESGGVSNTTSSMTTPVSPDYHPGRAAPEWTSVVAALNELVCIQREMLHTQRKTLSALLSRDEKRDRWMETMLNRGLTPESVGCHQEKRMAAETMNNSQNNRNGDRQAPCAGNAVAASPILRHTSEDAPNTTSTCLGSDTDRCTRRHVAEDDDDDPFPVETNGSRHSSRSLTACGDDHPTGSVTAASIAGVPGASPQTRAALAMADCAKE